MRPTSLHHRPGADTDPWRARRAVPGSCRGGESLAQLVAEAGFGRIDIGALVLDRARRAGTRLATLALFADLVHLSPADAAQLGAAVDERLAL